MDVAVVDPNKPSSLTESIKPRKIKTAAQTMAEIKGKSVDQIIDTIREHSQVYREATVDRLRTYANRSADPADFDVACDQTDACYARIQALFTALINAIKAEGKAEYTLSATRQ